MTAPEQSNFAPFTSESVLHSAPRPHFSTRLFQGCKDCPAAVEQHGECDVYDDSAIIVVEDTEGEWNVLAANQQEPTAIAGVTEAESNSDSLCESMLLLIGAYRPTNDLSTPQSLPAFPPPTTTVFVNELQPILLQEILAPVDWPTGAPSFAIQTDEAAALRGTPAIETVVDRPNRQDADRIDDLQHVEKSLPLATRKPRVRKCFQDAATALDRLIEVKAAKTVLVLTPTSRGAEAQPQSLTSFIYPLALAMSGQRRILLVDLVSDDACMELGLTPGAGVLEFASGNTSPVEAVLTTASPRVDLIPYGDSEFEHLPRRSLDTVRLATAITTLSRQYDLVLITAAIDAVTVETRLARAIDIAVLAAPCEAIAVEAIKCDLSRLSSIGIQPAGILLLESQSRVFASSME